MGGDRDAGDDGEEEEAERGIGIGAVTAGAEDTLGGGWCTCGGAEEVAADGGGKLYG